MKNRDFFSLDTLIKFKIVSLQINEILNFSALHRKIPVLYKRNLRFYCSWSAKLVIFFLLEQRNLCFFHAINGEDMWFFRTRCWNFFNFFFRTTEKICDFWCLISKVVIFPSMIDKIRNFFAWSKNLMVFLCNKQGELAIFR